MPSGQSSPIAEQNDLRETIRAELETACREFHALLAELSTADLSKPSLNPAWTVGKVLYHMSLAPKNLPSDVWLIRHLKWIPKFPAGPFNRLNVIMTRRGARNKTKDLLAVEYDQAHTRALKCLQSIRDEEWHMGARYPDWDPLLSGYVTIERLFHYLKLHFESHAEDIRQALNIPVDQDGLSSS
jgi:uncharacterized damage-inducible protein DinB